MSSPNSNNNDIQSHLNKYVQEHPNSSYEEWIGSLYPEGTSNSNNNDSVLLIEGVFGSIDESFYEQDSRHLQLWNNNLGGNQRISVTPRQHYQQEEFGGSSIMLTDLLSDDGEDPVSPTVNYPSPTKPGEDLLKFD